MSPGLDGLFGTADDKPVEFIPNVKPDFGLTVPFNAWMTFFGQFFDHGLDLVTKGTAAAPSSFRSSPTIRCTCRAARPTSWC